MIDLAQRLLFGLTPIWRDIEWADLDSVHQSIINRLIAMGFIEARAKCTACMLGVRGRVTFKVEYTGAALHEVGMIARGLPGNPKRWYRPGGKLAIHCHAVMSIRLAAETAEAVRKWPTTVRDDLETCWSLMAPGRARLVSGTVSGDDESQPTADQSVKIAGAEGPTDRCINAVNRRADSVLELEHAH